jgi:hypothetical protein
VRRSSKLQHSPVSPPEYFRPLADGVDVSQHAATVLEELLALCGQDKATPNAIKQPEAQFLLKIAELPRQGRLPYAQAHRRFRNRAQLGDGNEGSQAPQIHASMYV